MEEYYLKQIGIVLAPNGTGMLYSVDCGFADMQ